jgi:hypothetical protein
LAFVCANIGVGITNAAEQKSKAGYKILIKLVLKKVGKGRKKIFVKTRKWCDKRKKVGERGKNVDKRRIEGGGHF